MAQIPWISWARRPTPDNYQPAYGNVDPGVALQSPDDRGEISLIGKNITDRITSGSCACGNIANGSILGGEISGGTARGPAGVDEEECYLYAGREVWVRLTFRPFGG